MRFNLSFEIPALLLAILALLSQLASGLRAGVAPSVAARSHIQPPQDITSHARFIRALTSSRLPASGPLDLALKAAVGAVGPARLQNEDPSELYDPEHLKYVFSVVLEQWVGILPPTAVQELQTAANSHFDAILPSTAAGATAHLNSALISIVATLSGNSVTGIERVGDCFSRALALKGSLSSLHCFADPQKGPLLSFSTVVAGFTEQLVGYLPPNIVEQIQNIYRFYLSQAGVTIGADLLNHIDAAVLSVTASVAGNSVTFVEQLQQCATAALYASNPASVDCVIRRAGPVTTLQVAINGVIQQGFGYLPPNLVLDLQAVALGATEPKMASSLRAAFNQAFHASGTGPEFVTCFEYIESCVVNVVHGASDRCAPQEKCRALAHTEVVSA